MKHLSRMMIALVLAILCVVVMPAQVFADSMPEYISEVKVYMGSYKDAEKEGFTILKGDDGKPADLNKGAGGGLGSKGEKAVYLGYKTTTDSKEAITDLALMNMKGGYSVQEYEALMEMQMKSQIIPFVENFLVTINEYRENYNSEITANRARAAYVHDILNKLTDDDCGGKGLGDLLLNQTKYEMGDEAYNKLTDDQKKEHADILTIIAQANGKATLLMESLLTRASDTNEDSWIDRFSETTYEELEEDTELSPSDAAKQLAKLYDDDASTILSMWDDLKAELENYDDASKAVDEIEDNKAEINQIQEDVKKMNEGMDDDELAETVIDVFEENADTLDEIENIGTVAIYEYLDNYEYGDGTLLDFFLQDKDDVAAEIEMLYPLVASLTDGQRAGLKFINLKSLILLSETDADAYKDAELDEIENQSIYDGVDRNIYKKGGVALTSKALRDKANELAEDDSSFSLSAFTEIMIIASAVSAIGLAISSVIRYRSSLSLVSNAGKCASKVKHLTSLNNSYKESTKLFSHTGNLGNKTGVLNRGFSISPKSALAKRNLSLTKQKFQHKEMNLTNTTQTSKYLMAGFTVALVIFVGITTYLTWKDMKDHYKVDFTPIPHYMVDAEDITAYNEKGEIIVLKNQSAYYKAVECNRSKNAEYYKTVGTLADMNGDVGQQWLALYAASNENKYPILASSLKIVTGSADIPAGYQTGIHMFGSDTAFNLNSNLYDWNQSAKSIFVYYKVDTSAPSATGTTFTGGTLALTGGAGIALGSLVTAFAMKTTKKKKEDQTSEA